MLDFVMGLLTEAQQKKMNGIIRRWPAFFNGKEIPTYTTILGEAMGCRSFHVKRNLELMSKRVGGRILYEFPITDTSDRVCNDQDYEEKMRKGGRSHQRPVRIRWKTYGK